MAKLTLGNLTSLTNHVAAKNLINNNFAAIVAAMENTLSRDGTSPNEMLSDFDMNSQRILNLPLPVDSNEPVRLGEFLVLEDEVQALLPAVMSATTEANAAAGIALSAAAEALQHKDAAQAIATQFGDLETAINAAETAQTAAEIAQGLAEAAQTAAEAARDKAQEWATKAEDSPVETDPDLFSAFHWAQKAQAAFDAIGDLDSLTDVSITTPANGHVIRHDDGDWVNVALGTMADEAAADYTPTASLAAVALSGAYNDLSDLPTLGTMAAEAAADYYTQAAADAKFLEDLTGEGIGTLADVVITTPADGQVLVYDNGTWVNDDQTGGGLTALEDDPNPTLAGDLNLNGNEIIGTGNIDITGTVDASVGLFDGGNRVEAVLLASGSFSDVATLDIDISAWTAYPRLEIHLNQYHSASTFQAIRARTSSDGGSNFAAGESDYRNYSIELWGVGETPSLGSSEDDNIYCGAWDVRATRLGQLVFELDASRLNSGAETTMFLRSLARVAFVQNAVIRRAEAIVNAVRFFAASGNIAAGSYTIIGKR